MSKGSDLLVAALENEGVERIFPLYSPRLTGIEVLRHGDVRRAKLYYIREKVAREARRQLRRTRMMNAPVNAEEAPAGETATAAVE